MKKQRLGKGLGALITEEPEENKSPNTVLEVAVNAIDPNTQQPRKSFDDEKLKELSQSIKTYGVVQPIIVQQNGDRYIIIAGERRYRASRLAGLKTVPVVIKEYSRSEFMEVSLVENLQREDLNPIEEAQAMRMLMNEHDLSQDVLSERIGKSRSAVANTLRLLNLPEAVQDLVISGDLSSGHARCLVALEDDEEKLSLAKKIISLGLSVRATEDIINAVGGKKQKERKKNKYKAPEIEFAQGALSSALGTKVQISGNLSKGKITLSYYNKDQMQSIYDFLMTAK